MSNSKNVCIDFSSVNNPTCAPGYSYEQFSENKIPLCMDTCGDGSVQLAPRVYQCDDGNNVDGDGCSSKCFVEDGNTCILIPSLNNRSY